MFSSALVVVCVGGWIVAGIGLLSAGRRLSLLTMAVRDNNHVVRGLAHRIVDEAFACGHTDAQGFAETLYATSNPSEALCWLVALRGKILDRQQFEGDVPMPDHVEQEGDYDRMWFDTGVGQERFWVRRIGVLGEDDGAH